MTPLLLPTLDTDAEFARITAALTPARLSGRKLPPHCPCSPLPDAAVRTAVTVRKAKLGRLQTHYGPVDVPLIRSASSPSPTTPRGSCKPSAPDPSRRSTTARTSTSSPRHSRSSSTACPRWGFSSRSTAKPSWLPRLISLSAMRTRSTRTCSASSRKLLRQRCIRARTDRIGALSPRVVADAVNKGSALTSNREKYQAMQERIRTEYAAQLGENRWAQVAIGGSEGLFSILYPTGVTGAMLADLNVTAANSSRTCAQPPASKPSRSNNSKCCGTSPSSSTRSSRTELILQE